MLSRTQKNLKLFTNPRISLDPSHNNTAFTSKDDPNSQEVVSWLDKSRTKKRKKTSMEFLPLFWRRNEGEGDKKTKQTPENENSNSGKLTILNDSQVQSIEGALPSALKSSTWTLSFSTKLDDFSLKTLYQNLSETNTPGILLVIEDTDRQIFGAYSSCKLEDSTICQSSDECFLFTFHPTFRQFSACTSTGPSCTVIKGTPDSLAFGPDEAYASAAGLWIDSDLCNGRSENCKIFNSSPLIPHGKFTIRCLECWTIECPTESN